MLFQGSNGNGERVVGAVGDVLTTQCQGEEEASALIEGTEGDMVAVDSPDIPTQDLTCWFKVTIISN